jgi:hypothetical protein
MSGCQVLGLAVGVSAGLPGSSVSGLSQCRVAAFGLSGLRELDVFFITVSHCAWRHVISWSLATKKRSKENAFNHATLSVHSVQFLFIGAPKARCSQERRMFEPLLLANPDIDTLRHQCSRASTSTPTVARSYAYFLPHFLMCWFSALSGCFRRSRHHTYYCFMSWWVDCVAYAVVFVGDGLTHFWGLVSWWVGDVVRHAY